MPLFVYPSNDGTPRLVKNAWIFIQNNWRPIQTASVYIGGSWRRFYSKETPVVYNIETASQNLDLWAFHRSNPNIEASSITFNIRANIGSSSTGLPAITTGSTADWKGIPLTINISPGVYVVGAGGRGGDYNCGGGGCYTAGSGGPAIMLYRDVTINNSGVIGGGGGGGAAMVVGACAGVGGGGGAGWTAGGGGSGNNGGGGSGSLTGGGGGGSHLSGRCLYSGGGGGGLGNGGGGSSPGGCWRQKGSFCPGSGGRGIIRNGYIASGSLGDIRGGTV